MLPNVLLPITASQSKKNSQLLWPLSKTQLNALLKNAQLNTLPVKRIQNAHQLFKNVKINAKLIKTVGNGVSLVLEINLPSMLPNVLLPITASLVKLMDSKIACKNHVQLTLMIVLVINFADFSYLNVEFQKKFGNSTWTVFKKRLFSIQNWLNSLLVLEKTNAFEK